MVILDFEKPIIELEKKIEELKNIANNKKINLEKEIKQLEKESFEIKKKIYNNLTPWQKVQVARHTNRPGINDYINLMMENFVEFHGDRNFKDDLAILGGLANFDDKPVMVIGHQKGKNLQDNIKKNFGMAHPEGYKKSLRLMKLADKFLIPIIIFIDTPGAYPGIEAEERGQGTSIAINLREMIDIKTPILVIVTGEGGSGGALALGIGDKILMLEHAIYSVISPEGCAAILWDNKSKAADASISLKLTAQELLKLGIIDEIISEPVGGSHCDKESIAKNLKKSLIKHLNILTKLSCDKLIETRYNKFRKIGEWKEIGVVSSVG
ncbi:MAG: acetyl-CoA carboxylase carboxyltransferase subunit alpha [bacterium]